MTKKKNKIEILIEQTTDKNGCYLFKNINDNVIYVGKAKNIQKRIKQHFQTKTKNAKTAFMLKEINSWKTFITNNEKEALILENILIKKHFPKFNIILADDQTHPYIFISEKDKDPKYFLIWKKVKQPGTYYGPFLSKNNGQEVLNLLQTLFPMRRCQKNKIKKPCFYYHLQQCSGACFKTVEKEYYQEIKNKVKIFFQGKIVKIKKNLQNKIQIASKNLQFEQADKWQKLLKKIDNLVQKQIIDFSDSKNIDFINFYEEKKEIMIIIFFYQRGKLTFKKEGLFNLFNNNIPETIENFLQEIYTYHPLPDEIILPLNIDLKTFGINYKVKITHSQKGIKYKILTLIKKNATILLQKKAIDNKQINKIKTLQQLSLILNSPKIINSIEFLDLSYLDNKRIIAGFTHYLNGNQVFAKNKIYQLSNQTQHNEKIYFQEAILKHYQKQLLPDLLILDGGFTQLHGAKEGLKKINKKMQLICLVKNKKHQSNYILTSDKKKITLPKTEPLWLFLSKIQISGHLYVIKNLRNLNKLNT